MLLISVDKSSVKYKYQNEGFSTGTCKIVIQLVTLMQQRQNKQVLGRVNAKGTAGPYTSTAISKAKVHDNILRS